MSHLPEWKLGNAAGGPARAEMPGSLASQYAQMSSARETFAAGAPRRMTPMRLPFEHVFRFDLTKEWVYATWPRKSTGLADAELFGVRVPLVTGTNISDLAGSLTYYFDAQGQLQHISFRGRTGYAARLIDFLARNYKFQRANTAAGEELFQVQNKAGVESELRLRPDAVLQSASPHDNFMVELELARPGSDRTLPPRAPTFPLPL
jgi:hypothetical protein